MGSQSGTCLSWEGLLCQPPSRSEQDQEYVRESRHGSKKKKNSGDDDDIADIDEALTMYQLLYKVLIYIRYLVHLSQ